MNRRKGCTGMDHTGRMGSRFAPDRGRSRCARDINRNTWCSRRLESGIGQSRGPDPAANHRHARGGIGMKQAIANGVEAPGPHSSAFFHDLRQCVATGLLLSLVTDAEDLENEAQVRLATIHRVFEQIRGLINAEDGEAGPHWTRLDLAEIVDECVRIARFSARGRDRRRSRGGRRGVRRPRPAAPGREQPARQRGPSDWILGSRARRRLREHGRQHRRGHRRRRRLRQSAPGQRSGSGGGGGRGRRLSRQARDRQRSRARHDRAADASDRRGRVMSVVVCDDHLLFLDALASELAGSGRTSSTRATTRRMRFGQSSAWPRTSASSTWPSGRTPVWPWPTRCAAAPRAPRSSC